MVSGFISDDMAITEANKIERPAENKVRPYNSNELEHGSKVVIRGIPKFIFSVEDIYRDEDNGETWCSLSFARYISLGVANVGSVRKVTHNLLVYQKDKDRFKMYDFQKQEDGGPESHQKIIEKYQYLPERYTFQLRHGLSCKYIEISGNESKVLVPASDLIFRTRYLPREVEEIDRMGGMDTPYDIVSKKEFTFMERIFQVASLLFFLSVVGFLLMNAGAYWDMLTTWHSGYFAEIGKYPSISLGKALLWTAAVTCIPGLAMLNIVLYSYHSTPQEGEPIPISTALFFKFTLTIPGLAMMMLVSHDWLTCTCDFYKDDHILFILLMIPTAITYLVYLWVFGSGLLQSISNMIWPAYNLVFASKTLFDAKRYKKYFLMTHEKYWKAFFNYWFELVDRRKKEYDDSFWE